MTVELRRRIGFELELLAPRGSSRRTLADALAQQHQGTVHRVWHEDSEPSLVPALGGRFLHLTLGFDVRSGAGEPVCSLVDDVTIAADLDPQAAAPPGWYRVLTDDPRLVRLLARTSDPEGPLDSALTVAAELWGVPAEQIGSIWRIEAAGATIALAAPAGGERERPCEIVTPPIRSDHEAVLETLLTPARELGFTVPAEAAVHLHVDGAEFRDPAALANLVRLFAYWREPLRKVLGTNPACTRLAPLPAPLVESVSGTPSTDELRAAAAAGSLTKFFDVNLTQVLRDDPVRDTVEIRILPGAIRAEQVMRRAAIVSQLLDRCLDPEPFPMAPDSPSAAIHELGRLATA